MLNARHTKTKRNYYLTGMKKIVLLASTFCFFWSFSEAKETIPISTGCKTDTLPTLQLIIFLQQMNVESYYGKPVDSFMLAIDAIPYNMKVYGGSHSKWQSQRASHLWYEYSGGPVIRVYVSEYTHMNRFSLAATWDVNLFRQEKIYKIEVWKDQNTCINGSCM
jgi:hypothetical protein